jgi:YidC/Oxa1 family membrane protein insertase
MLRKGALDHFDTIFCYSRNHNEEVRASDCEYGLREKKLVNVGFGLLDMLIENFENTEHPKNNRPQILIGPSWQKDNILDYCLDPLLESLFALNARIIIRPHPEYMKRFPGKMMSIFEKYKDKTDAALEIQTDFSSNSAVYNSDLVITDWSSIAQEFSFTTKKPSLFINTPMKVMNPDWRKIDIEPMDIWIRDRIGISLDIDKLDTAGNVVKELLEDNDKYKSFIEELLSGHMYNVGHTAEAGGEYIIGQILDRRMRLAQPSAASGQGSGVGGSDQ